MKQIIFVLIILTITFSCSQKKENSRSINNKSGTIGAKLMEVWESGDTSLVNELFHEECEYVDIPNNYVFEGLNGVKDYISHVHKWGSDIGMEIRNKKFEGDVGYIEWTFSAIQSNPIRGRVPIATNKEIKINGVTLIEIKDNKIKKATDYLDALGFVIQLGSKIELPGGVIIGGNK